jgi:hypothetical protein
VSLATMHFALRQQFDMNEIYSHLTTWKGNNGRTTACVARAFLDEEPLGHPDPWIRNRTFVFVNKYYAVVPQGHAPAPWERSDKVRRNHRGRAPKIDIEIAECNSVLALSLDGPPAAEPTRRISREKKKQQGFLFDTFAPWTLLSIQSFPDDEHSDRSGICQQLNGPYAFLDALIVEYGDAVKRLRILHEQITDLITPEASV